MISAISAIDSASSSYSVSATRRVLSQQTKTELESLGIDTTNIQTETQGQVLLQSVQGTDETQEAQSTQETQSTQQSQSGGENSSIESIMEDALSLAQKVGASVSANDKLEDILSAIGEAITDMQAEAANNPQQTSVVAQYQSEYQSLCQSISEAQSSQQQSSVQAVSTQQDAGMNALASYNIASMSMNKQD